MASKFVNANYNSEESENEEKSNEIATTKTRKTRTWLLKQTFENERDALRFFS